MNISYLDPYKIICSSTVHIIPLCYRCKVFTYTAAVILILLIPPTVFLNSIAFAVIFKTRKLHTPSNILLASTALCDFFSSTISMPLWIITWLLGLHQKHSCTVYLLAVYTSHVFSYLSFLLVSFISFDRYLAIFKPFFYSNKISSNVYCYVRLVLVISSIVFALNAASFLTPNKQLIEITILLSLPTFMLHSIYVHFKILFKVKDVRKNIEKQKTKKNSLTSLTVSCSANSIAVICSVVYMKTISSYESLNERKLDKMVVSRKQKQVNICYLTCLLLLSLYFCYTPYIMVTATWRFKTSTKDVQWTHVAYMFSYAITCIKSFINPILYCYRSKEIKKQIKGQILSINFFRSIKNFKM
ncbi:5-hydroxytryptamine receptor 1B isoform X2 [Hydra vulgaris]|uniref:5-hydroxytryptamine receptor 1B isoform X2 n=1 Tax=Hydra vulgaris TaxID=6087 RepID=A0ABM4CQE7_HYDVU